MKRILEKLTPALIDNINSRLLKNNALAWQLQLPRILWFWFLITIVMVPIVVFFPMETDNNRDTKLLIQLFSFITLLHVALNAFFLIQFNKSKIFGSPVKFTGIAEQCSYLFSMILPFTGIIFMPVILDFRKADYLAEEQFISDARTYNKARHFILDDYVSYKYFPDDSSFKEWNEFSPQNYKKEELSMNSDPEKKSLYRNQDELYSYKIKPRMSEYFTLDPNMKKIDPGFTRERYGPLLYYTGYGFLPEKFEKESHDQDIFEIYSSVENKDKKRLLKYQYHKYSDVESIKLIADFIKVYNKYNHSELDRKEYRFDVPVVILKKWKSNQFEKVIHKASHLVYDNYELETYNFERTHATVLGAKYFKWNRALIRGVICFFIALGLSILLFIFKNVRLKEFILSFVWSILIYIVVMGATIFSFNKLTVPLHTFIFFFFTGLFFVFTLNLWKNFSHIRTYLVMLANLGFPFALFFLFFYFTRYHNFWELGYEFCEKFPLECEERQALLEIIRNLCLGGGVFLYLTAGSLIFKRFYEKMLSLPLRK